MVPACCIIPHCIALSRSTLRCAPCVRPIWYQDTMAAYPALYGCIWAQKTPCRITSRQDEKNRSESLRSGQLLPCKRPDSCFEVVPLRPLATACLCVYIFAASCMVFVSSDSFAGLQKCASADFIHFFSLVVCCFCFCCHSVRNAKIYAVNFDPFIHFIYLLISFHAAQMPPYCLNHTAFSLRCQCPFVAGSCSALWLFVVLRRCKIILGIEFQEFRKIVKAVQLGHYGR